MNKSFTHSSIIAVLFILLVPFSANSQTFFTEKAKDLGIDHFYWKFVHMGGGAAWFDYNNDGHEDVYITAGSNRDVLYENNGDGTFTEVGVAAGLDFTDDFVTNGVVTGDIDNDGFRDIFVTTTTSFHNILMRNNGDGTFTDISQSSGIMNDTSRSMIATMGDVNLDGYLDIYVGNYVAKSGFLIDSITQEPYGFDHDCYPNLFFINNGPDPQTGDITFTEIGQTFGVADSGCALAATFTDYDSDGDLDFYIANDFGEWVIPNSLYRNNFPSNNVTDVSQSANMDAGIYGMGIAIGDYDQDLDLDYYVTNIGRNGFYENNGDGTFIDLADSLGVDDTYDGSQFTVGWGTVFADVDNDTDLDLFVTNGHVPAFDFIANQEVIPDRLFINNGDGTFTEDALNAGTASGDINRGSACADYDMDGDLDHIVVPVSLLNTGDPKQYVQLFRNDLSNSHNWLKVKLEGTVNNRDAFGAHIKIVLSDRSWLHEIPGGSSHASQNSSIAHFGLGSNSQADSLIIIWPGGKQQVETNVNANQLVKIVEDTSLYTASIFSPEELMAGLRAYPNPFSERQTITYQLFKKSNVNLSIFNQMGQEIIELENKMKVAGKYEILWNGEDRNGRKLPSGIYFARLFFGGNRISIPIQIN